MDEGGNNMKEQAWNKLRDKAGFTLVELIVVIAILGILAGIGTVGYSGYIKKANEAADVQTMGEVKYAAQIGIYEAPDASGMIVVDNSGVTVTSDAGYREVIEGWLQDAFGSDWANVVKLKVSGASDWVAVPLLQFDLTDTQKILRDTFNKSNLSGNEIKLADSANNLSNLFADWLGTNGVDYLADGGYMSPEDLAAMKERYGLDENSTPTKIANATVLYVASKASGMNAESILNRVANEENGLTNVMNENGMLPTAALMYGTMAGYANSGYASQDFKDAFAVPPRNLTDVMNLVTKMNNDSNVGGNVGSYMSDNNKGALADMNGYLGAMQIISDYEGSFDITIDSAFNNDSTLALLQGILGSK